MSILKDKSDQNATAFSQLKQFPNTFSPAIHCAYYSCFLLIVYVIKVGFEGEYEKIKDKKGGTGGVHGRCIKFITDLYRKNVDDRDGIRLLKDLKELKRFRISADYEETYITKEEVEMTEEIMKRVNNKIKKQLLQ